MASAAVLGWYLAPYAEAHDSLPLRSAGSIFFKAKQSLKQDAFAETMSYQNSLVPASVNLAEFFNAPLPGASVATVNLYQNSPQQWRVEEVNAMSQVVGVVARENRHLVTYRADTHARVVTTLPAGSRSLESVWPIPTGHWQRTWRAQVTRSLLATLPVYQVTLFPRATGTLFGSVTYWFQGRYFIPMGMAVTDRTGQTVFEAKTLVFTQGAPGASAKAPAVGHNTSYRPSNAAMRVVDLLASTTAHNPPVRAPLRLGPLPLARYKAMDSDSIAIYGDGARRVIAIAAPTKAYHQVLRDQKLPSILQPLHGSDRFYGTTDAIVSVVSFREGTQQVILIGSWPKMTLMRWAKAAWH